MIHGDTDVVPRGVGTFGSRSLQTGGVAVHQAAGEVVDQARQLAADLLEAAPEDVVLDKGAGRFHVAGTPAVARSLARARSGLARARRQNAHGRGRLHGPGRDLPVRDAHRRRRRRHRDRQGHATCAIISVDDAGTILNPLLAEGQIHGGIAQGAAQALLEEFAYDEQGNPLTDNFADYAFPSAAELPSYETRFTETPTPRNPLGAKGIGESGTIGSTPAVQNAVVDALTHLGVVHVDMPTTPMRVWQAIQDAQKAAGHIEAPARPT